jgi:Zn-dependent protease with chaperone function
MIWRIAAVVCFLIVVPAGAQQPASRRASSSATPAGHPAAHPAARPASPKTPPPASRSSQLQTDDDDDADVRTASLYVHASPRGNVTISASLSSFGEHGAAVLDAIPAALGCDWIAGARDESSLHGICRGWLITGQGANKTTKNDPADATLRLAPVVASLRAHGADLVWINLSAPRRASTPPPDGWKAAPSRRGTPSYFTFESGEGAELPAGFPVLVDGPLDYSRLFVPVAIVLLLPGLLAYAIRTRALNASTSAGQKVNWIVWMNWISLGSWLYWISAIDLGDLGEMLSLLGYSNVFIPLALGVAIYALPPLLAVTTCMGAMAPLLSSSKASFQLLLKRRLAGEATILVPLGIFLVGAELTSTAMGFGTATLSLVIAYTVYRGLAWFTWTLSYSETKPLESGELFDRAAALAKKAGVALSGLRLLRTRVPEEANAFASSGNKITLTESLIKGLTPREVDSVIAHELGHHKAGHTRINYGSLLFIGYVLVAGPLFGWLILHYHLPQWFVTLPITPLLFTVLQGMLSQRREFSADARAVEITGDAEGAIAALARLAQLSRIPVQTQGIMGSILSHPSMEKRVLALARRNNIPDHRALEILKDPDAAYTGRFARLADVVFSSLNVKPPLEASSPSSERPFEPVFTLRTKMALHEKLRWLRLLAPLVGACILAAPFAYLPFYPDAVAARWLLVLAAVPIFAFQMCCEYAVLHRFAARIRKRIARNIHPQPGAMFAGIHPGEGARFTDGLSEWDFGFITLENDWMCYRGDKTQFAIPRQDVKRIETIKGRRTWFRAHRVEVGYSGGCFTLSANFAHSTVAEAQRTARKLRKWAAAGGGFTAGVAPAPPPMLPRLPGQQTSRWKAIWMTLKIIVQLWIAATLIFSLTIRHGQFGAVAALGILMFSAPLAVVVRMMPSILWPVRRDRDQEQALAGQTAGESRNIPDPVPSDAPAGVGFKS